MKKKVTIKDVAEQSGVSISTVSQILNGNSQNFSPDTVKRVFASRDDLKYQPDYFAQRMVVKKSKTIGVIVPDIANPFFATLIKGIESKLYKENFITILCNVDSDEQKESDYLTELSRRGVDGYIIAASVAQSKAIKASLRAKSFPFIVMDQQDADQLSDAVLTDDYDGGKQAAKHLKELGHQNVAVVIPKSPSTNIQNRLRGFQAVYGENFLRVDAALSKKGGKEAASAILSSEVTAIFASNDEIAFGLYHALQKAGKTIPQDYSIIGYDNVDMCEYVTPQLTTVAQPIFKLGEETAKLLLSRLQNPTQERTEKVLAVDLIKRFSTARLSS